MVVGAAAGDIAHHPFTLDVRHVMLLVVLECVWGRGEDGQIPPYCNSVDFSATPVFHFPTFYFYSLYTHTVYVLSTSLNGEHICCFCISKT